MSQFQEEINDLNILAANEAEEELKKNGFADILQIQTQDLSTQWTSEIIEIDDNDNASLQLTTDSSESGTGLKIHGHRLIQDGLYSDIFIGSGALAEITSIELDGLSGINPSISEDDIIGLSAFPSEYVFPVVTNDNTTGGDCQTVSAEGAGLLDSLVPNPTPVVEERKIATRSKTKKVGNRQRLSISESSVASPSVSQDPLDQSSDTGGKRKAKKKMYELPNKEDPLVQRAGYAKSYREKRKIEYENLKNELQTAKDEIKKKNVKMDDQEKTIKKQEAIMGKMKRENEEANEKIKDLKEALQNEKEQNSLNPQQTEKLLNCINDVVKAACPENVILNLIVPSSLANKKGAALGQNKIKSICSGENLSRQSCTISFDFDEEKNKLTARTDV